MAAKTALLLAEIIKHGNGSNTPFGSIANDLALAAQVMQMGRAITYNGHPSSYPNVYGTVYPGIGTVSGYPAGTAAGNYGVWGTATRDTLVASQMASAMMVASRANSAQTVLTSISMGISAAQSWLAAQQHQVAATNEVSQNLLAIHQMQGLQLQNQVALGNYTINRDAVRIDAEQRFFGIGMPMSDHFVAPPMPTVGP